MMYDIQKNPKKLIENARKGLEDYLKKHPSIKSLIIGLSGGIDSALTLALAHPVAIKMGIQIQGYSLPIQTNHPDETKRAEGMYPLCHFSKTVDLGHLYNLVHSSLHNQNVTDKLSKSQRIQDGNIKARLRMIFLYDRAYEFDGMVLSTDNLTEYLLGFWTLHGDVGDFGMLQNCWKTEVYSMANLIVGLFSDIFGVYQAFQDTIDAIPTDGLGVSSSDLEQLGVSTYAEVDKILLRMLKGKMKKDDYESDIIKRFERTKFKRKNPYNLSRKFIIGA